MIVSTIIAILVALSIALSGGHFDRDHNGWVQQLVQAAFGADLCGGATVRVYEDGSWRCEVAP